MKGLPETASARLADAKVSFLGTILDSLSLGSSVRRVRLVPEACDYGILVISPINSEGQTREVELEASVHSLTQSREGLPEEEGGIQQQDNRTGCGNIRGRCRGGLRRV